MYVWTHAQAQDRALSLALGREPTFSPRSSGDPSTVTDFDDDSQAWKPYFVNSLNCPRPLLGYVYQPGRRVTSFRLLARLCLVRHSKRIQRSPELTGCNTRLSMTL